MVNNRVYRAILPWFFCIFCLALCGQNIKKHYVLKIQEKGNLYHFLPVTLFEDANKEKLSYDLTYTSWNDSIMMNFTFKSKEPLLIDTISYISGNLCIKGAVEKLYVEPTAKKWIHRYSIKSKSGVFAQLYSNDTLPEIILYSNGKEYYYHTDKSSWNKYIPIGEKIFKMIHL